MINIQNALKVVSKFLSNDKINQALELSKGINSPQSAIAALSKLGDPNKILDSGLNKLNNPMAQKMAGLFGANDKDLEELKNQIIGLKGQVPQQPQKNLQTKQSPGNQSSRFQDLLNGLK